MVLRLVGQQDKLDAEQRDEDEDGPHSPHVQAGLGLVRHPQLGDEDPDDVQQEEEVHLESNDTQLAHQASCSNKRVSGRLASGLTTRAAQMGPWTMYRKSALELTQHL